MYKKHLILFILYINSFIAFNQESIYFNNVYNPVNTYGSGRGIIQVGNYYYGIFGTLESTGYWYNIGVFKMSLSGNLVDWNLIGEDGQDFWSGSIGGTLIYTYDGNFAFACHVGINDSAYSKLVKLNTNLNIVWQRNYSTENDWTMTLKVKQASDGGFILVGRVKPQDGEYYNLLLMRTDFQGNELWYKTYGDFWSENGTDVIETPDGGYLIGGYFWKPGYDQSMDAMVIKTDSLGNEQWTKYYGNPNVDDDMALVAMADDGNYLVATVYGDSIMSNMYREGRIWIIKIDINGNIIEENKFGPSTISNQIKNFRKIDNGIYICSGFKFSYKDNYFKGWIFKFNENMDSIWMRDYHYYNGFEETNFFYDAYPTTDNGYIAIGKARPDIGNNKMWIVKVDSMGCDTPGCATGTFIKELPLPAGTAGELRIWPNPAEGEFKVMPYAPPLVPPEGGKPSLLTVYNSQGIKVKEINIPATEKITTVNVRDWQRGIYYVRMTRGGKNFGSGKVVVR